MKRYLLYLLISAVSAAWAFVPLISTNDYRFTTVYNGYKWNCENQVCKKDDHTLRMEDLVFINEAVHERLALYNGFHIYEEAYDKQNAVSPFGGDVHVSMRGKDHAIIKNSISPNAFWGGNATIKMLSNINHWENRFNTPFFVVHDCPFDIFSQAGQSFEYDYSTEIANDFIGDYSPYYVITNSYKNYGVETTLDLDSITNNFISLSGRDAIFSFLSEFTRIVVCGDSNYLANDPNGGNSNLKKIDYYKYKGGNYDMHDYLESRTEDDSEHRYKIWSPKSADLEEDTEETEVSGNVDLMGSIYNDATTWQLWNLKETYDRNWNYQRNDYSAQSSSFVKSCDYGKTSWSGDVYMSFGNENTYTGSVGIAKYETGQLKIMVCVDASYIEEESEGTNAVYEISGGGVNINPVTLDSTQTENKGVCVLVPVTVSFAFMLGSQYDGVKVVYLKTEGLDFDTVESYCCDALGIEKIIYAEDAQNPTARTPHSPISSWDCGGWHSKYKAMDIRVTGEVYADIADLKFDTEIVDDTPSGGGEEDDGGSTSL